MPQVFNDSLFQAQWLRTAGHSSSGGAELAECLAVARGIREIDRQSWFNAWYQQAQRVLAAADDSNRQGRRISALGAYLRASNYFRAAYTLMMEAPVDTRLVDAYRRHAAAFEAAARLLSPAAERIAIPYDNAPLHGYIFRAEGETVARPTLIITGGYDSTAEEAYFFGGASAVARGYTCIAFDGPGQGAAIIENKLGFRPDWEAVVRRVVDYAITRPEVDKSKIALLGISFGGYLAPRAASGESRLAACIADPGEFSLIDEIKSRMPPWVARSLPEGNTVVLALLKFIMQRRLRHPTEGWGLRRAMWLHGVASPLDYIKESAKYNLEGLAQQIRCPTLVCTAENDEIGVTARDLYDKLTCAKSFIGFTAEEGADAHCEAGARSVFNQRAFDWLDTVLNR
jgi:pimeloyl-ACP methyl ester carboxylesterase